MESQIGGSPVLEYLASLYRTPSKFTGGLYEGPGKKYGPIPRVETPAIPYEPDAEF